MAVSREANTIYQALLGKPTFEGSKIRAAFKGIPLGFIRKLGLGRFSGVVEGGFSSEYARQLKSAFSQARGLIRATPTGTGTAVPVVPGLTAQQWEVITALQAELGRGELTLAQEQAADARRLQEAQLGANPADFVAYELYKRSLQEQGFTPQGNVRSDAEIQELVSATLGLEGGDTIGAGQFGVDIPTTQSISRSELRGLNPTDVGILSSFLRGGVETGEGQFQGINPEDYFTELEEGLIPTLPTQRTQFEF